MNNNLALVVKDDWAIDLIFKNATTGVVIDITGSSVYFCIKRSPDDTDANAVLAVQKFTSLTDPTNGATTITVANTLTDIEAGEYYYQIVRKDATNKVSSTFLYKVDLEKKLIVTLT